jgi:hypothetical protein
MKTAMRQPLLIMALLALTNTGCLDFEKQTMVVTFSKDGQDMQVLMVYDGLGVSGNNPKDLETAKDQLAQLVRGEAFYMGDPLVRVYLKPGKYDEPKDWDKKAMKVLGKHIVLGQGLLLKTLDGRYAYCQPLTVRDPASFVAWLNQIIAEEAVDVLRAEPKKKGKKAEPIADEETITVIEKAAKNKFAFLRVEPGRIAFTVPGTPKFFADLKRDALGGGFDNIKKEVENLLDPTTRDKVKPEQIRKLFDNLESEVNLLADTPWSLDQRRNQVTLALGWGDGHPFRLTVESAGRPDGKKAKHNKDLFAFAETLGATVRDDVSLDQVLEEFQRSRTLAIPRK